MITCPKCNREQYYTCGKESCVCNQRVPQGEKPQVYFGNDIIACPYCGFAEHIDFWAEREMQIVAQANNSVYTDAGDSAVSTSSLQASVESTSQTVTHARPSAGNANRWAALAQREGIANGHERI